ncbi:MAG: hypothetical protein ACPGXL_09435, partial [Chitinophagales bacterium]
FQKALSSNAIQRILTPLIFFDLLIKILVGFKIKSWDNALIINVFTKAFSVIVFSYFIAILTK